MSASVDGGSRGSISFVPELTTDITLMEIAEPSSARNRLRGSKTWTAAIL